MAYVKLEYRDYVVVRNFMQEFRPTPNKPDPTDMDYNEIAVFAKVSEIIRLMDQKRADEDAGIIAKPVFHRVPVKPRYISNAAARLRRMPPVFVGMARSA